MEDNEQFVPDGAESVEPQSNIEGEPTEAPAVEPQPEAGNDFDPSAWQLNYKGQNIIPKDREHLINLAQQGHAFSQNQEQLNKDREAMQQQYEPLQKYSQLDQTFQQNPAFAQQVMSLAEQYQSGQLNPQGQEVDPQIQEMRQTLSELQEFKSNTLNSQADMKVQNELNQLKQAFPNGQWGVDSGNGTLEKRVIEHALSTKAPSLEMAYKSYMWDNQAINAKADALKQSKQTRQANVKAGFVQQGVGNSAPPAQAGYKPGMSYNDLTQQAINSIGG